MDTRFIKLLLSPIGSRVENYLIESAKDIIKPKSDTQPPDKWFLSQTESARHKLQSIDVEVEGRVLIAHRLTVVNRRGISTQSSIRKAIVYMPGNNPNIMDSLPTMQPLMEEILDDVMDSKEAINLVCYCQHYRGRGANQKTDAENFNDYPMLQDAKDQAALIHHLTQQGYHPSDILLVGYSYGSAVAIAAVQELVKKHGDHYKQIKFFSDRGFGNPFDLKYLKPLIYDITKAHQRLHEKEMMPQKLLRDVIVECLPYSVIFHVEGDQCIWPDYSLASSFTPDEMMGKIFEGCAERVNNPHYADRSALHLKYLSQIQPHHLMTALLLEKPIRLLFYAEMPRQGYALSLNAKPGDLDYIDFPRRAHERTEDSEIDLPVISTAVTHLVGQLDRYCAQRAERAIESGYGSDYNHAWFGRAGMVGWTARQQIEMAVSIMKALCDQQNPDVATIMKLKDSLGPHHSGELRNIFENVYHFAMECERINRFNQWVYQMKQARNAVQANSRRLIN